MERLIELMVTNPRNRFHIPMTDDYSIWDLEQEFTVDPNEFLTKGIATPFTGEKLFGVNYLTVKEGNIVYQHSLIKGGN